MGVVMVMLMVMGVDLLLDCHFIGPKKSDIRGKGAPSWPHRENPPEGPKGSTRTHASLAGRSPPVRHPMRSTVFSLSHGVPAARHRLCRGRISGEGQRTETASALPTRLCSLGLAHRWERSTLSASFEGWA